MVHIVAICDAREKDVKYLATKADLEVTTKDLRNEMKLIESRLDHKIDQVESRLLTAIHKMESSMKTWFLSFTLSIFVAIIAKLLF